MTPIKLAALFNQLEVRTMELELGYLGLKVLGRLGLGGFRFQGLRLKATWVVF